MDVGIYSIDKYTTCKQTQLDHCGHLASGFAGAMRARGHAVRVARAEGAASPKQWRQATDADPAGVDTIEFAYLATHSGTHGLERQGSDWLFWWLATFQSPDGCIVSTIELDTNWRPVTPKTPNVRMRLGDGRLRWCVLDCCRSLQLGVENERKPDVKAQLKEANPERTWGRCIDGISLLLGFTGLSSDASWTVERGVDFGHRAGRGEPLADGWLDEAYSYWVDDVPVALACGRSEQDAGKRLRKESLKARSPQLRSSDIRAYAWMWRS